MEEKELKTVLDEMEGLVDSYATVDPAKQDHQLCLTAREVATHYVLERQLCLVSHGPEEASDGYDYAEDCFHFL